MDLGSIRRKTRKLPRPTLRTTYGELILREGTILYHVGDYPFAEKPEKQFLFTSLHPSEWHYICEESITPIRLKRDISLFFMIGGFRNCRILPVVGEIPDMPCGCLKYYKDLLPQLLHYIKKELFNGWISTIRGGGTVEVCLLNDTSLYEPLETKHITRKYWRESYMLETKHIPKDWGTMYPISVIENPATLTINSRYKENLELFVARFNANEFAFQILLSNATINYIDAPMAFIHWAC